MWKSHNSDLYAIENEKILDWCFLTQMLLNEVVIKSTKNKMI